MSEGVFWLLLVLVGVGAAAIIWLLLPRERDDEPIEHGDGEQ